MASLSVPRARSSQVCACRAPRMILHHQLWMILHHQLSYRVATIKVASNVVKVVVV